MLQSSSFRFRKPKSMHLYQKNDVRHRKVRSTSSHRTNDVSRTKLLDIFKSLRHRKLLKGASRQVSLTRPRSPSPPIFACHTISPTPPLLPAMSPPLCVSRCCSDAVSILSVTEEDYSSGMSLSSSSLDCVLEVNGGRHHLHSILSTSPSAFQLRSESTKDYLVERLEQHLQRLSIGGASPASFPTSPSSSSSAIRPALSQMTGSDNTPMDVYFENQRLDTSLRQKSHPETSSPPPPVHVLRKGQLSHDKPNSWFPNNQEVTVPVIVITSVGAEQAKPFQPSAPRSFRPPSNLTNGVTNNQTSKFKQFPPEDPFISQSPHVTYPSDYHLTFRIPPSTSTESSPAWYVPETPTPMGCNHFGDCSRDLWDILHPPLVTHPFMLPPFELPPLNSGPFGGISALLMS
ncbi:hypothetical protein PAXRUDRAFT_834018 [Paxillus rubicundulus Ve08.2h10]|uniref:Uncharacterized protein n=1 Tax=Paxillus rubicundulus Ve08.2h10 TaxID=930991 RepID=A0A0D0DME4_9AGAM|nr:hypothetical protein PAXRUDRAFT_834018 [Paxillus rubicundulus Ve08.2h10]